MRRWTLRTAWVVCALLACEGQALAQDGARCRPITAAAERLACYDALVDAAVAAPATPAAQPTARMTAPAPAPAPAPSPKAVALPPDSAFGLPVRSAAAAERNEIESMIPGAFEGWRPRESFTLANGQVWQIADESEGAYSRRDAKVRIVRGRLGGYFLYVEGIDQNPRVRRLK